MKENEDSLRYLRHNIKQIKVHIKGLPEEKWAETLSEEIIAKNFPNLGKETDIQVQEAQKIPNKMDPKRFTPRHIILQCQRLYICLLYTSDAADEHRDV